MSEACPFSAAGRWLGGRHADTDRVLDELFTDTERRFPHEPEGTPVCVFYNTYDVPCEKSLQLCLHGVYPQKSFKKRRLVVQGYLTCKKTHPPRTLPQAYA